MKDNYFMIDGKKIPMSDKTAKSIIDNRVLTIQDILNSRYNTTVYYATSNGGIQSINQEGMISFKGNSWNVNTKQRVKQLQAIALMMNVADYFNDKTELTPNIYQNEACYTILIGLADETYTLAVVDHYMSIQNPIYFENKKDAQQAINILGKDTIILALTGHGDLTDYETDN